TSIRLQRVELHRGSSRDREAGAQLGNSDRNRRGAAARRYGDSVGHVRAGLVRSDSDWWIDLKNRGWRQAAGSWELTHKGATMNTSAPTLIHLDGVTNVFFTDEVETHALA